MSAPKGPRPITRAIALAKELRDNPSFRKAGGFEELLTVLDEIDGSSTHEDSGRKRKRVKAAKRPAKKAGRR